MKLDHILTYRVWYGASRKKNIANDITGAEQPSFVLYIYILPYKIYQQLFPEYIYY